VEHRCIGTYGVHTARRQSTNNLHLDEKEVQIALSSWDISEARERRCEVFLPWMHNTCCEWLKLN
jgi:hypothetical protein